MFQKNSEDKRTQDSKKKFKKLIININKEKQKDNFQNELNRILRCMKRETRKVNAVAQNESLLEYLCLKNKRDNLISNKDRKLKNPTLIFNSGSPVS